MPELCKILVNDQMRLTEEKKKRLSRSDGSLVKRSRASPTPSLSDEGTDAAK